MTATARPPLDEADAVALLRLQRRHERDSANRLFCAEHPRLWVLVAGENHQARKSIRRNGRALRRLESGERYTIEREAFGYGSRAPWTPRMVRLRPDRSAVLTQKVNAPTRAD